MTTPQVQRDQIAEAIAELNEIHAVIRLGGKTLVMNETVDPLSGRLDVTFSTVTDFNYFYKNKKVEVPDGKGTKLVPKSSVWMESAERREYEGLVFAPSRGVKDVPGYYNLWRGLAVTPKQGNWSKFRHHIKTNICSDDEEVYQYVLTWLADLVQDPGGQRPGSAIVLRGNQGVGKGVFVDHIGQLIEPHFLHISNQQHLVGNFNSHLKDALLVFCDEAYYAGSKKDAGVLKALITEKYHLIEPKGKDPFRVENHVRLIVASNSRWVIPAGSKERRFLVLDIGENHLQDREYFKAVCEQMQDGGLEAMLHDLLELEYSKKDLWDIPQTDALFDQKAHSMSTVEQFWYGLLREGSLGSEVDHWNSPYPVELFHKKYVEFVREHSYGKPDPIISFGSAMQSLLPDDGSDKRKGKKSKWIKQRHQLGNVWGLERGSNWRPRCYVLTSLDECREHFESLMRYEIDWDENLDEI